MKPVHIPCFHWTLQVAGSDDGGIQAAEGNVEGGVEGGVEGCVDVGMVQGGVEGRGAAVDQL